VSEGAIEGVDLFYELRRAQALLRKQALPAEAGSKRTEFKTFGATTRLEKGRMVNDDLRLDSQYLKASGRGSLDIATQGLDYRLTAVVVDPPAQGAGAELADLKSLEIPIRVTGTLADIKVRPDLDALVKSKVKSEVAEKIEEKKEDLRKSLDKRLKDLFNR
jgi:AsmA protein